MINNAQRYQNELTAGGYKIICTHSWANCYKYDWHYMNNMCQIYKDIQVIAPDIQRYTNDNTDIQRYTNINTDIQRYTSHSTKYTKIYQSYALDHYVKLLVR